MRNWPLEKLSIQSLMTCDLGAELGKNPGHLASSQGLLTYKWRGCWGEDSVAYWGNVEGRTLKVGLEGEGKKRWFPWPGSYSQLPSQDNACGFFHPTSFYYRRSHMGSSKMISSERRVENNMKNSSVPAHLKNSLRMSWECLDLRCHSFRGHILLKCLWR